MKLPMLLTGRFAAAPLWWAVPRSADLHPAAPYSWPLEVHEQEAPGGYH